LVLFFLCAFFLFGNIGALDVTNPLTDPGLIVLQKQSWIAGRIDMD
jgi:hypothetical protein